MLGKRPNNANTSLGGMYLRFVWRKCIHLGWFETVEPFRHRLCLMRVMHYKLKQMFFLMM